MKRWITIGFAISIGFLLVGAMVEQSLRINQYGGMYEDSDPLMLPDDMAQESENVITDLGNGLEPREGFIAYSTEPAKRQWVFAKSNGTRYHIVHSGNNLKSDTGAKLFTTLVSTVAAGVVTAGAQLGDYFYFCNTVDGLKRWDGTTVTVASSTMTMDKLVAWKGRLAGAGKPGAERTIFLSRYLVGTDWTLETTPTDDGPSQITVGGALDENITGLFPGFKDLLIWFKNNSFGGLYGSRRSNFVLRTFSESVGSNHPDTAQDCDGLLRFLGPRRTVWEFDGTNLTKISEGNNALFDQILNGESNTQTATITSQADFAAGTLAGISTAISAGDIMLSTWTATDTTADDFAAGATFVGVSTTASGDLQLDFTGTSVLFDNFSDGDYTSSPAWSVYYGSWTVDSGKLRPFSYSATTLIIATTSVAFGEWSYTIIPSTTISGTRIVQFYLTGISPSGTTLFNSYRIRHDYSSAGSIDADLYYNSEFIAGSSNISVTPGSPVDVRVVRRYLGEDLDEFYVYINGTEALSTSGLENTDTSNYIGIANSNTDMAIDDIRIPSYPLYGQFVSRAFDTGLSSPSWSPSVASWTAYGNSITIKTQVSNDGSSWDAAVAWTTGTAPSSAKKRFVRYQVDFSTSSSGTGTPYVSDVTLSARQTTGTFVSDSKFTGTSISSWNVFQRDETLNDGAIVYGFYTDTDTAKSIGSDGLPVVGTFTSSQTITNNTIPSLAVAPYAFVSGKYDITAGTQNPTTSRLSITWNEGSDLKAKSVWTKQRYWLATSLANTTSNDTIFVYDRRRHWQKYTGMTADSMLLFNSAPLFSNTGGIFQAETGTSDNGADITSTYTTKYFFPSGPEARGYLREVWMTTTNSDATLSTSLLYDGNITPLSLGSFVMNERPGYQVKKLPIPFGGLQMARHVALKWTATGTERWKVLNGSIYFDPDTQRE